MRVSQGRLTSLHKEEEEPADRPDVFMSRLESASCSLADISKATSVLRKGVFSDSRAAGMPICWNPRLSHAKINLQ
jgi:hypothetical protein